MYIITMFSDRSFAYTEQPSETNSSGDKHHPPQPQSRTAPGRLEANENDSEDEHQNLKKVIEAIKNY